MWPATLNPKIGLMRGPPILVRQARFYLAIFVINFFYNPTPLFEHDNLSLKKTLVTIIRCTHKHMF